MFIQTKSDWAKICYQVFRRDGFVCQCCRKRFQQIDLGAHHILPRSEGGPDAITNLITLCNDCHDMIEEDWKYFSSANLIKGYAEIAKAEIIKYVDDLKRPNWHAWVYGSARNPTLSKVDVY